MTTWEKEDMARTKKQAAARIKLQKDLDLLRACVTNLVTLPLNHPAIETSLVNLENLCKTVRRNQHEKRWPE